jgi:repressor LexA
MTEPLTPMERRVYHYLIDFLAENTFQPSIREIAKKFRIKSTKTVSDLLISLANKGYIERQEARSRGVRLIGFSASARTQPVPVYRRIQPGEPALVEANRSGYVTMDRRYLPTDDVFLIAMRGESMSSRGILDGDLVLVSPSTRPKEGDLIAARHGPEATVRQFSRDDGSVLGVVCGVFRPLHEHEPPATESDSPE